MTVSTQDFREEKVQTEVLNRLAEHARRAGKTINDLLNDMLDERECMIPQKVERTKAGDVTGDEWARALRAWAASHPVGAVLADDSRESIYEGRGE
jgi:hypothetical protein